MRKSAIAVAVAAVTFAIPVPAFANAGQSDRAPGTSDVTGVVLTGWVGSTQGGKNMATTQYEANYRDPVMGPVQCTGVHQTGKNAPGLGTDSFTCASTTGFPLRTFSPEQDLSGIQWNSDYYPILNNSLAVSTSVSGQVSADGMSLTAVATYFPVG
ncbi:hypothetical protein GCM10011492_35440 [Flexivirga endophytica]|uniref:Secreted protein n=1 Tax=Flexivirga endophytica TaxID=1849103 RepID=A0A916WY35_9MICO|nr:hypothetical protein [Flexivirga endophytica]GGB41421.1 hypothetical protein GCM10011492_35440 [Flexivirga endophytica]GHB49265.1 hypothetical protein GCM10008112_17820 [Flexivirga endophytica]